MATDIFREDLDAGYVAVLVEMIAGASSTPGLGPEVSARLGPWFAFAEQAVTHRARARRSTPSCRPATWPTPSSPCTSGLEMLTHLDGDPTGPLGLFAHAKNLAALLEAFDPAAPTTERP